MPNDTGSATVIGLPPPVHRLVITPEAVLSAFDQSGATIIARNDVIRLSIATERVARALAMLTGTPGAAIVPAVRQVVCELNDFLDSVDAAPVPDGAECDLCEKGNRERAFS